jgi:hypothetical protein
MANFMTNNPLSKFEIPLPPATSTGLSQADARAFEQIKRKGIGQAQIGCLIEAHKELLGTAKNRYVIELVTQVCEYLDLRRNAPSVMMTLEDGREISIREMLLTEYAPKMAFRLQRFKDETDDAFNIKWFENYNLSQGAASQSQIDQAAQKLTDAYKNDTPQHTQREYKPEYILHDMNCTLCINMLVLRHMLAQITAGLQQISPYGARRIKAFYEKHSQKLWGDNIEGLLEWAELCRREIATVAKHEEAHPETTTYFATLSTLHTHAVQAFKNMLDFYDRVWQAVAETDQPHFTGSAWVTQTSPVAQPVAKTAPKKTAQIAPSVTKPVALNPALQQEKTELLSRYALSSKQRRALQLTDLQYELLQKYGNIADYKTMSTVFYYWALYPEWLEPDCARDRKLQTGLELAYHANFLSDNWQDLCPILMAFIDLAKLAKSLDRKLPKKPADDTLFNNFKKLSVGATLDVWRKYEVLAGEILASTPSGRAVTGESEQPSVPAKARLEPERITTLLHLNDLVEGKIYRATNAKTAEEAYYIIAFNHEKNTDLLCLIAECAIYGNATYVWVASDDEAANWQEVFKTKTGAKKSGVKSLNHVSDNHWERILEEIERQVKKLT